jgi:hypothetical protein
MATVRGFATPEEAVLAGYVPGVEARVLSTRVIDDYGQVRVVSDTEPSHPIEWMCQPTPEGWIVSSAHGDSETRHLIRALNS